MSHLSRRGSLFCSVARGCSRWILPNVKKLNQVMLWGFRTICTLISLLCFSIASMEFTNTAITGNATVSSNPGISSPVPTTTSYWKSMNSSTFRSTSLYNVSQDSNGTTAVTSGKDFSSQAPRRMLLALGWSIRIFANHLCPLCSPTDGNI